MGLPPEAVLVEMYISEEMANTYQKMAQAGLVRQTLFHSPTSQYGAMSQGTRFLGMGLRRRMAKIFDEIDSGSFAREWSGTLFRELPLYCQPRMLFSISVSKASSILTSCLATSGSDSIRL